MLKPLAPGFILTVLARAGKDISVSDGAKKVAIPCVLPGHADKTASAVVLLDVNAYKCAVCTPRAIGCKELAGRIGIAWPLNSNNLPPRREPHPIAVHREKVKNLFSPQDAERMWNKCLSRALDDEMYKKDIAVYEYINSRGLGDAWNERLYGILPDRAESLHPATRWWLQNDHRIVVPLYNLKGELVNIQSRSIKQGVERKVLFPADSTARGTVFANLYGLELLRGAKFTIQTPVIMCEGLTDYLCLSIHYTGPVFGIPGTGMASSAIGDWAREQNVFLALDNDKAGDEAIGNTTKLLIESAARSVSRLKWPRDIKDACDALAALGAERFQSYLIQQTRIS